MSHSFNPADVKEGAIIFVQSDLLDSYFKDIHTYIKNPYKLITHNGDREHNWE